MDKRILIPTDFSKNALNAARYAIDLYAKVHCEFYFLNIFRLENYTTNTLILPEPGSAEYETAKVASEEGFVKFLDILKLHQDNPRHRYHTISTVNFLSEAMEQTINNKDIDLVVMGTQGATGAKGVIFGSNTVNAMEKIRQCPVMAIPEKVRFMEPKEIVFPTNFLTGYKRKLLNYMLEIAKMHSSSIRVVYVTKSETISDEQEQNKQLLQDILEYVDHSFHMLSEKKVAEGLTSFVESRDSDMIAFINKKHFLFNSIFSKPLVKEIGYDAKIPILALNAP
ncbi:universal stress protein [Arenibacter aquaticus]|uniref:Universal stress protein n=1 Tax=Arenibacter aquaticus TaxID=2489054 RepID=A0A430JZY1_9FLAO|nr:universal stress protein [Arenibacter aquaticus]RTE52420.1 universal stress protein [Arenibacter aquaticus]